MRNDTHKKKVYSAEPITPRLGDKVKQGGITWTYKTINLGNGRGKSLMWYAKIFIGCDVNGKQKSKYIKAATVNDGIIQAAIARKDFQEAREQEEQAQTRPTVKQAFDKYIEDSRRRVLPPTIMSLEQTRDLHLQGLMDVQLDELTREQVQTAIDAEKAAGHKVGTIKHYITNLNSVRGFFGFPPFRMLTFVDKSAGETGKSKECFLTEPEKLLETVSKMGDSDLFNFCVFGCMSLRLGEICGLKYSDIFEKDGRHYIHVHGQRNNHGEYTPRTKTNGSTRDILLDERFYLSLETDKHGKDEYICPYSAPKYAYDFKGLKTMLCVPSNLRFSPHTLRHIFKTYSDVDGRFFYAQHLCGGWDMGGGVAEKVYQGRDEKNCDEFMLQYYKRIFRWRDLPPITVTKTA